MCPACGAASGDANRCPHCRAVADVEPHAALGFRCLVCGGPRIALDLAGVTLGPTAEGALREAAREQTKHWMFTAGGALLLGMGALAVLVASAVVLAASPGALPATAAILGAFVPLLAGAWALRHAAGARERRGAALQRARVAALANVQAVTGVLDGARVAEALRLDPEQAELLLAEASVASLLNEAPVPRLRVDGAPHHELENAEPEAPEEAHLAHARKGDTELRR